MKIEVGAIEFNTCFWSLGSMSEFGDGDEEEVLAEVGRNQYVNWDDRAQMFAYSEFAASVELYRALLSIRNIEFAVKAKRSEARRKLEHLTLTHIVARRERFREGTFVNLSEGTSADKYSSILRCLDISERHNDGSADFARRFDDARVAFTNNIQDLLLALQSNVRGASLEGIWNRCVSSWR